MLLGLIVIGHSYDIRVRTHGFARSCTDSLVCFLERNYLPGAAIDWYYQYQTLYLRLMANNQLAGTTTRTTTIEDSGSDYSNKYSIQEEIQNNQSLVEDNNNQTTMSGRGSSRYLCPRCGNDYTRLHSLNRHVRFECGVEPQFECPICHKKSKHKHNLILHMRTHQKS